MLQSYFPLTCTEAGYLCVTKQPTNLYASAGDAVITLVNATKRHQSAINQVERKGYKPHMLPTWLGTNTRPAGSPFSGGRGQGGRQGGRICCYLGEMHGTSCVTIKDTSAVAEAAPVPGRP